MDKKLQLKVLIIEQAEDIGRSASDALKKSGWEVTWKKNTHEAFQSIEDTQSPPFILVISGVRMPDMDGDKILARIGKISPFSQKMVIIPAREKEILIRAVNMAGIHACLSWPFDHASLVNVAEGCRKNFEKKLKSLKFKRLIELQNRQLYETARNFNNKYVKNKQLINEKKIRLLNLKAARKNQEKNDFSEIGVERFADEKKLPKQPDAFAKEFLRISRLIRSFIQNCARRNDVQWDMPEEMIINFNTPEIETEFRGLEINEDLTETFKNLKSLALIQRLQEKAESPEEESEDSDEQAGEKSIEKYIEIKVSDDYLKAVLKKRIRPDLNVVTVDSILELLRNNHVSYGIVENKKIWAWINSPYDRKEKFIAARGTPPVKGQNGKISYKFKTDYTNPGKILEDGSIDFRERGEVPFVKKGDLLAVIRTAVQGTAGINIAGGEISVDEVYEPPFSAGQGTVLSEDGFKILSDADGQPHVDSMGNIIVTEELVIHEDVDFKTGNVNFQGNIVVKGMVKPGFSVKGINLTVKSIEGAEIELSGDLNVSEGMTNTKVKTVGNIYTKFINNCEIYGFGNFTVLKEIIDSSMWLSGSCEIPQGHIIASNISAKQGIESKNIGTKSSTPSVLRVGIDDHIDRLENHLNKELDQSMDQIEQLKKEQRILNRKNRDILKNISEAAHIQDRAQLSINECRQNLYKNDLLANSEEQQNLKKEIDRLREAAGSAEADLNTMFDAQDEIATLIEGLENKIQNQEKINIALVKEKKHLMELKAKKTPDPKVIVNQKILHGTKIKGPNSSLILHEDRSKCTIREIINEEGIAPYFEMAVIDL